MERLKLIYIALVATVLILIALTGFSGIYQSIVRPNESATFTTQAMVEAESYKVFEYEILNREGQDTNYKICVFFGNTQRCFWQPIKHGRSYTYKRYFYPSGADPSRLTITVYKENNTEPIENATYFI
jgi:hypothetical protein